MSPLLPLEEALAAMRGAVPAPPATEPCALAAALGRVLAVDVQALVDVPGDDNSAMDGYALRAADAGASLPLGQRIPAGAVPGPLAPGSAARIFTGGILPPGADAVAMQEDCEASGEQVTVRSPLAVGANVRRRGQDLRRGEQVLARGCRLTPQDLGLLASQGIEEVPVYRRLRVALLCTGDELVEPGQGPLTQGQIYNSNRYMLSALLQSLGCEVLDLGIVRDEPAATRDALARAAAGADCIVSSGGVSVGEEDHVRAAVIELGALDLWRLAIKPGKPLAFGRVGDTPFIGLPGNPTSSFVTFCLLARPFLRGCQGGEEQPPPKYWAQAGFEVRRAGSRQDFRRVRLEQAGAGLRAVPYENQSSGVLSSVCRSDALAVVPAGETLRRGDPVQVLLLSELV